VQEINTEITVKRRKNIVTSAVDSISRIKRIQIFYIIQKIILWTEKEREKKKREKERD